MITDYLRDVLKSLFLAVLISLMILIMCLFFTSKVSGQCVRSRYTVSGSYHAPVTYQQSTYSYAPAYTTYTPSYAPAYTPTYYTPRVVELVTPPDYYYSVRDYYRDQLLADAIAYRILTGRKALENGSSNGNGGNGNGFGPAREPLPPQRSQPSPEIPNSPPFQPPATPAPAKEPPVQEPVIRTEVNQAFQAQVSKDCMKCHNGSKPERINLSDLSILSVPARSMIFAEVNAGSMPQGGKEWSNDMVKLAYEYYTDGKKAVKGRNK